VQEQTVSIVCADGFKLGATLFEPTEVKSAVMVGPATGIKRQFYSAFAAHLAEHGFAVLTFDNRGIGQSIEGSLNDGNPSLTNWGLLDMTAALEYLKSRYPGQEYHLLGHSAGGQLVGMMENAGDLKSMFNFGSSSGSLSYSKYPFKFKFLFWVSIFIPLSNLIFGHTKSQWVGMGEPLPKKVASEWSRWCKGKGYIKVDLDSKIKTHLYDDLTLNSLWVHAQDDDIATDCTVKDMIRVYSKINSEIVCLLPEEHGYKDIGHMKFFSKKKKKLWQMAIDWLDENSAVVS